MKQPDELKEELQNIIQKTETSELASSQDVIKQLMQIFQK